MSKRRIIFRADGNSQIGLGHVVRSLALADMLKDDFLCVFAIQDPSEAIKEQIETVCDYILLLPPTNSYLKEANYLVNQIINVDDIVVLDGYYFNTNYQYIIKENGNKLVCIDDIHAYHFVADVVINHAGGINPSIYSKELYTRIYIGPRYALLRKPFLESIQSVHKLHLNNLLICMGGADPNNTASYILHKALGSKESLNINLLIGSAYSYKHELITQVGQSMKHTINIHTSLNSKGVSQLMKSCGMAICSPSSVAYEYCATKGLLFLHKTADNQQGIFNYLLQRKAALSFVEWCTVSDKKNKNFVEELLRNQKEIFEGQPDQNLKSVFDTL